MALTDLKITNYADNIAELPDTPSSSGISATQLKAMFDGRTDKEIKEAINGIIEILSSVNGASNVSATPVKLDGADTVQGILDELEQSKIDKTAEADYMRISAYDADEDGVVDNAMALAGQPIEYFETKEEADDRYNEIVEHLEETDLNHNSLKTEYEAFKEATTTDIANRVEKEEGKGLSKNDLTDELKGGYDDAVLLRHWHDNKSALDTIPSGGVVNTLGNDDTTIPTSKAVAEAISFAGGGDMLKATYDSNNNGIVDNSEALEGHSASYFAKGEDVEKLAEDKVDKVAGKGLSTNDYTDADKEKVDNALPLTGGTVNGDIKAHSVVADNQLQCGDAVYTNNMTGRFHSVNVNGTYVSYFDALRNHQNGDFARLQINFNPDNSARLYIPVYINSQIVSQAEIYGDHNLDYVKQKLGGGDTVQYKKVFDVKNISITAGSFYTLMLPKTLPHYDKLVIRINWKTGGGSVTQDLCGMQIKLADANQNFGFDNAGYTGRFDKCCVNELNVLIPNKVSDNNLLYWYGVRQYAGTVEGGYYEYKKECDRLMFRPPYIDALFDLQVLGIER